MIRYFDASALVKRYARESGSQRVHQLLAEGIVATSRLSEVEVASALVRRCHEGAIPVKERDRALTALNNDFSSIYVVELVPEVTAAAVGLLTRCRLRAGDAIQLAACLYLQQHGGLKVEFVAYDAQLTEAARQEGVPLCEART